eukprot:11085746-Alexandrium_andersonii.AAC.1
MVPSAHPPLVPEGLHAQLLLGDCTGPRGMHNRALGLAGAPTTMASRTTPPGHRRGTCVAHALHPLLPMAKGPPLTRPFLRLLHSA